MALEYVAEETLKHGHGSAANQAMPTISTSTARRAGRPESAFTLVELLVVLLIAGILLSLSFYALGSARKSGRHIAAVAAANAYADAADRFAREHEGRYPAAPGARGPSGVDWDGGAQARRGPKSDVLGRVKYYLRTVPEAVQDGSVAFGRSGPARIDYRPSAGGTGFVMTVTVAGSTPCVITGGAATDARKACSKR